jgi:regulator of sigma E protease
VDFDLSGLRGETQDDPMALIGLRMYIKNLMVGSVFSGSAASEAGIAPRDMIEEVNGKPVTAVNDLTDAVDGSAGEPVELLVRSASGERRRVSLRPRMTRTEGGEEKWMIGVRFGLVPELVHIQKGPVGALGEGFVRVWDLVAFSTESFVKMVSGKMSPKSIGGPVTIGDMAGQSLAYGLLPFLSFLAMVSVSLGFLNLLPVPVLDGGHIAAFLWEIVTGRPLSERTVEVAQKLGLGLLGLLMVFALTNDFSRLFGLN